MTVDMPSSPQPPSYRSYGSYQATTHYHNCRSTMLSDSEYTPLVPPSNDRKKSPSLSYDYMIVICVVFLALVMPLSAMFGACIDRSWRYNDLDPDVLARIRQEWRIEVEGHKRAMQHAREQERQWGEKERNWESGWREKVAEWNQKKDEWRRKEQNWDVEWNEMIRRKRAEWNHQEDEWHKKEQNLKREWNEMMRRKRKETERVEREKREREHMNLYWENIQGGDHCIAHKTKMYTARLANLLPGIDALEACRSTPLTIHGVTYYTPTNCEDRRDFGDGIRGHWTDDDEPMCSTFWEYYKIKDCLAPGSGLRRVETPLGNLGSGDNPDDMCYSTPAVIYGRSYRGPNAGCVDWGKYGHWGIWDIPDDGCN